MRYTFLDLHKASEGKAKLANPNALISHISIDSRTIIFPAETLFFAFKGIKNDGHQFIEKLYKQGVRNFVVSDYRWEYDKLNEANFIITKSVLCALQKIAALHRRQFSIPIVGITGSNGKTIVKEWLSEFINKVFNIVKSPKSFNSQIGVPLSVLMLSNNHGIGVFEAGISQKGEMDKLEKIIRPDVGIFTNIGTAHQENFNSIEEKINEKLHLFQSSSAIIYNSDIEKLDNLIKADRKFIGKQLFTWSLNNKNANLFIKRINKENGNTAITGVYNNTEYSISIPFVDKASVENSISVWAYLFYGGLINQGLFENFKKLQAISMRMEQKEGVNNSILINDSYSSDIESVTIALEHLKQYQQDKKRTLIISDILQSGKENKDLYKEVNELLSENTVDKVYGIGSEISKYASLFTCESHFYKDTNEFLSKVSKNDFSDEVILIKGARNYHFEKVFNFLEYKTHQTQLEINLSALIRNLNYFRSKLKPDTQIMAMVKAFSYGSGSYEIANILQYHNVDYLAVAYTVEGIELREAGINLPIMVMNPNPDNFDLMIEYNLEPEIYSFEILQTFLKHVVRSGSKRYPVHIKIDTGMRRLGFVNTEIPLLLEKLVGTEYVQVRSVFSHLATADVPQEDAFTEMQIEDFFSCAEQIAKKLEYPFLMHILNSAGILRKAHAQFNMVRLGIGLYGADHNYEGKLENVSSLKTIISQLRSIKKGASIGYSRAFIAENNMTMAVIPVGYADGLNRHLSKGIGRVFVNGKYAPIVGNICMDMCMIDVSDIDVGVGDSVEIFGDHISIAEIAETLDTIPYEILTSISQRVKRVYFQE